MAGMSPQADSHILIWSGVIQGFGMGLAYVSLTIVSFVTLSGALRNEGAAFFNLMRNIGSSIGISAIQAYVTRSTAQAHATLTEHITPFTQGIGPMDTTAAMASMNQAINVQSAWIGYLNAFYLMVFLMLAVIPLIAFARSGKQQGRGEHMAVE
jgi:DHA2 family multidrug resistance protein